MLEAPKRKTSLTLDATALDTVKSLGIKVPAVANRALQKAVTEARSEEWLRENAQVFADQSAWHEQNGHSVNAAINTAL